MPTTFTFKEKSPINTTNFSGVVNDGDHFPMNGAVGSGPQTVDISGTPVVSPATVSNAAVTTLTTPNNAISVSFLALTNTVNISESDPTVAAGYFTIPTGVVVSIDVGRCGVLYLKANTGSSTLSFWYNIV